MSWLINAAQFDKFRKSQKNLIIFDASFHMDTQRDGKQEFLDRHILDAQFFNIDLFSDPLSDTPHTLLNDESLISQKLSALGIRNDYKIIFYDNSELHSAARAVWMLKMFGHNPQQLYILDGGLNAWEKFGGKMESGEKSVSARQYNAAYQPPFLRTLQQMKDNLHHPKEQVIDVRHSLRFAGGKEPRPHMRSGHIPGSFCLPYTLLFDKEGYFQPLEKIKKLLWSMGVDFNSPIIAMCGSGITAATLDFALDILEHSQHSVYDGSWAEWGSDKLYLGETDLSERPVASVVDE